MSFIWIVWSTLHVYLWSFYEILSCFFLGKCGVWFEQRWRSLKSLSLWSGWFSCWNPNSEQQIIGPCWIKKVSLFMNKYTYILAKKFTISACTTQYAYKIAHSSKFMGKTFQAAQLTHERFLTIEHSCKIFFWYLPNWTFTKWSKRAKIWLSQSIFYVKKPPNLSIFFSLKNINSGPHFL